MAVIEIQGIDCHYRNLKVGDSYVNETGELVSNGEEVLYSNLPKEEQYFRRESHPFSQDELTAIATKELTYDKFNPIQKQWIDREKKRFNEGLYASINGELKFIPGAYWCYVNYWTLEHGDKPEYREDDRLFFLFHEYLRLETDCLGITRGKGRRQGATSIGTFFMWFIGGRTEHSNVGLTSYNDTVAQEVFQKMFMFGLKSMLPFFQEDTDSDSENYVWWRKPVEKKKRGHLFAEREGLNSYADFRPNAINSYDSGRQAYNMPDEGGKRIKLNINSYWSKLYKTFLVGRNKKGFGYLPTTVNKRNEGGENFKIFWKNSNQNRKNKHTGEPIGINTPNRCVRFFMPATRCYAGCIDLYGNSVIDDPVVPVMGNDGRLITEGSKTIILREREALEESIRAGIGEVEQLMEHRRDYPLTEFDMFAFEAGNCEFNERMLTRRIDELDEEPVYLRRGRLTLNESVIKGMFPGQVDRRERSVGFMDDENGDWLVYEFPFKPNDFDQFNDNISPRNTIAYTAGVDTFRIGFAEDGSKGTICIFKKSHVINGVEHGCYPVAIYTGRPRLVQFLYDEVMKACMWYGCKVNIEISAGDYYYGYFHEKNCVDILYWTPARDPHNKNQKIKPGTETASPFELAAQLEAAKIFFDGNNPDTYNGNIHRVVFKELLEQALAYSHDERTPFDLIIALMMALLPALRPQPLDAPPDKPVNLLPTWEVKRGGGDTAFGTIPDRFKMAA